METGVMETGEMERFNKRTGNLRTHHDKCERRFEKAQEDLSSQHEEMEPELLSSSNSGSDEDYHPSQSPTESSDEGEVVPERSGSSGHSDIEKVFPSSSEHEVIKGQRTKTSNQTAEQSKRRKKNNPQITVKSSKKKDGRRVWDKAHYCLYCKEANLNIARHLERKHKDETDVAHAFSFPPGSKQRKTLIDSLRNKGDWQHNVKVLEEGDGEIVTWKQPSKKVSVKDYLPCQHCYAMFKRTELWRHEKSCRNRKGETEKGNRRRVQKASSQLMPMTESSEGIQTIIHTMQQDHVTFHIRSDEMICTYGESLFAKKGREQSQHRYIAQKLRELGRLVLAAKEIDKSMKSLKEMCDPTKFELVIKATRKVSNFSAQTTEYGKPSTAVKIGFSLKGATEAWIGRCLMTSDILGEKKAKKFKELLENSWSSYVSANAHSTIEQRRWNIQECVPLTEDVITLQNYLRKIEDEAKAELSKHASTAAYKMLSESLLAQIIVFNKKREGEASRLTLETYQKADTGPVNKDIYETLTPVEKQLSHRLTRIVTRGKRGRKVPILLLERTKSSLDFLIKKRSQVGVTEENPFLFARIGTATNIRGCDCLRKYAAESKVSNPELLRSTKLRKHVATLCQLLDLDNQELEQVARFMGHDIRVHCDYYRQTDKTFQVAKIGKLLFAMEHGAGLLKGKSLKTLDSVVFGHDKGSPTVEEGETSVADRLPDAEQPSPSSACQQMTLSHRQDNEVSSSPCRTEGGEQGQTPTIPPVEGQKKTAKRKHCEDVICEAGDEEESPRETTKHAIKRQKKISTKQKYDADDNDDDDYDDDDKDKEEHQSSTRLPLKREKMPARRRVRNDTGSKMKGKRPWSEEERTAVQRSMAKFVALRRVPAKEDCLLCIGKESPVLSTRTWKDVKYYVYNEIIKIKRKLSF